ncbi:hypothetical protein JD844_028985 [Phrynosoma platyrhinos]|uniref:Uncharacterized protein n=1 Tax=Phrynosoma platyrhinos TaxID=52577 RepID=A0ABQ7SIN2_PHRPL|nr:hypothetical protein JD844_028985 [Phrynosoma platyrhinos]
MARDRQAIARLAHHDNENHHGGVLRDQQSFPFQKKCQWSTLIPMIQDPPMKATQSYHQILLLPPAERYLMAEQNKRWESESSGIAQWQAASDLMLNTRRIENERSI